MYKDLDFVVGLRIRSVREMLHMTREQFSERCDISDSFLAAVEGGRKGITVKTLYKICRATDVSPAYFMGLEERPERALFVELMGGLKEREQTYAIQMLSTYSLSVRELESEKKMEHQHGELNVKLGEKRGKENRLDRRK